jgi:hypothetical protein
MILKRILKSFVSSPACDLPELCDQYFNNFKLLLDKYDPLISKTIHKSNNSNWMNESYCMAKRAIGISMRDNGVSTKHHYFTLAYVVRLATVRA